MLHNSPVKRSPWVVALVASLIIHGALAVVTVPALLHAYTTAKNQVPLADAQKAVFGFAIGWSVIVSIWCAMVTNVLSKEDNRWGGLKGAQLFRVVAGLTIALDIANSGCLWTCPPTALVIPILSYVAISNNATPVEESSEDKSEPTAHG